MDTPFKRVAVDVIGPIHPPSEQGHRYILTFVHYATRYPDSVCVCVQQIRRTGGGFE